MEKIINSEVRRKNSVESEERKADWLQWLAAAGECFESINFQGGGKMKCEANFLISEGEEKEKD